MLKNNFHLSEPFSYINDLEFSKENPIQFWDEIAKKYIHWDKEYESVLSEGGNNKMNPYEWFKGGKLNACFNLLDRHIINGRGNETAFVCEVPPEKLTFSITYQDLYDKVTRFSRSLKNLGIKKGDIVLIYMHNSIEAIVSMLSCLRIGAIHNTLFGGYQSENLSNIIERCKPSLIITTNYGYMFNTTYRYSKAIKESLTKSSYQPANVIVYKRTEYKNNCENEENQIKSQNCCKKSINWIDLLNDSIEPLLEYELVESNHPLFIIFTSGTTSKPKCLIKETSSIVSLAYTDRVNYGLKQGDSYFSTASFGWVSGPCLVIYGCLLFGAKSVFTEGSFGGDSLVSDYWSIAEKHKFDAMTIGPWFVRTLIKYDPNGEIASKYNLSSVKKVSTASEKVHQSIIDYLTNKVFKRPIINNEYGQTESAILMISNPSLSFPIRGDSIGKMVPGFDVKIVSKCKETNKVIELGPNEIGDMVVKLPLPPSFTFNLLNDDSESTLFNQQYLNEYPGYYKSGDICYYDSDGYLYFVSRGGEYITVSSYTLNTTVVENEVLKHPMVNDCSVIGLKDEIYGSLPIALIILNDQFNNNNINQSIDIEKLKIEINQIISNNISMDASLHSIVLVQKLPKTKVGKKIKSILTQIFNNEPVSIPSSLEDENIISYLINVYNDFIDRK